MYPSPADLQAPLIPVTVAPDLSHPCQELLAELLICVIHSELSQESSHERQD